MSNNDQEVKSPDKLELRGKPTTGVRFGKKAGFVIATVVFTVLGLVLYGIATREPAGTVQEGADGQPLAPGKLTAAGADAAGRIYAGVPDGMAVPKPEPAITPATASTPEAPLPTQAAAVPNLGAQPAAAAPAGQGGQPPLTPEQQAAQRLKEQREAERQKAMIAEAAVPNWSGSAGNTVVTGQPGGANPALAQLQAAARGLQGTPGLAQLAQAQGGGDGDDQNKQARKEAFLTKASLQPDTDYLKATVKEQISKFELKTTAVIPAVLISGINSDLPGDISAQVTDDIYDTATGRFLLIPKGTTIYGNYDSRVAFGQERVLVAWSRLQFPNGSTLNLEGMTGGDAGGYAGFHDQVNNHYGRLIGFGIGTALFSAAFQLSQPQQSSTNGTLSAQQTTAAAVGQQLSQLGMQVTSRNLNIQPTLEIRPGYQFVVKVNKDVVFPKPYK